MATQPSAWNSKSSIGQVEASVADLSLPPEYRLELHIEKIVKVGERLACCLSQIDPRRLTQSSANRLADVMEKFSKAVREFVDASLKETVRDPSNDRLSVFNRVAALDPVAKQLSRVFEQAEKMAERQGNAAKRSSNNLMGTALKVMGMSPISLKGRFTQSFHQLGRLDEALKPIFTNGAGVSRGLGFVLIMNSAKLYEFIEDKVDNMIERASDWDFLSNALKASAYATVDMGERRLVEFATERLVGMNPDYQRHEARAKVAELFRDKLADWERANETVPVEQSYSKSEMARLRKWMERVIAGCGSQV